MNLLQAIIVGIIQGLTEFIPVSSSGHMVLVEKAMGLSRVMTPEQITAFNAVIQLGTLAAVLIYFFRDIIEITLGFVSGNLKLLSRNEQSDGERARAIDAARLGWLVIVGSLPIGIIGLAAKKIIEGTLTKNLWVISLSMIVWAILLMLAEMIGSHRKQMSEVGYKDALAVGVAQVFALIPGSSRSGTTICAALFSGLRRDVAARFSFLLSIPAIGASGLLELKEAIHHIGHIGALNLVAGTIVAGIVGYASIAFLLSYLRTHTNYLFIGYRLIVGLLILGLVGAGLVLPV
ncbi:MAG TPA: undecaprenyl-diphosphatase UppP [Blastocatellia bacterium]|nr:undecaprenyl-diphosphatase UppP [Blastocatellia bacterium]